jgi:hypothetical protein
VSVAYRLEAGLLRSKRSLHKRRKSDVSHLRKLTMAEFGNTRVRKSDIPDLRWQNSGTPEFCGDAESAPGLLGVAEPE